MKAVSLDGKRTVKISSEEYLAVYQCLNLNIHHKWLYFYSHKIKPLTNEFFTSNYWPLKKGASLLTTLYEFLLVVLEEKYKKITTINEEYASYLDAYAKAQKLKQQRRLILEFMAKLGRTKRQLRHDKKAFKRFFGHDVVIEYYKRHVESLEKDLSFIIGRIAQIVEQSFMTESGKVKLTKFVQVLEILVLYPDSSHLRLSCLEAIKILVLQPTVNNLILKSKLKNTIYTFAQQDDGEVWEIATAIDILTKLDIAVGIDVIRQHLQRQTVDDHIFVRRRCVLLLPQFHIHVDFIDLVALAAADASPYVRQSLAEVLPHLGISIIKKYLPQLALHDADTAVQAKTLLIIPEICQQKTLEPIVVDLFAKILAQTDDDYVIRVSLKVMVECITKVRDPKVLFELIQQLQQKTNKDYLHRWCAIALETIWCLEKQQRQELYEKFAGIIRSIPVGRKKKIKVDNQFNEPELGRILALLCLNDHGLDVRFGKRVIIIYRGFRFKRKWWRALYELLHGRPDKRQGYPHTIARYFLGNVHIPSQVLSEVTQTTVPGEPFYIDTEDGWRGFLPLVDELLSLLGAEDKVLRLYTCEGVTEITRPKNSVTAYTALSLNYKKFADLRNWSEQEAVTENSYIESLRKLGFIINFKPYDYAKADDHNVTRFFNFMPLPILLLGKDIAHYFSSIYANSFFELALFLAGISALFIFSHIYKNVKVRFSRRKLPLVIGGWGTRGKSGVERLKAALFHGLGFEVFSKTTGSEAMFMHSRPKGPMQPFFLYRSYDKASIWEQTFVVKLAQRLKSEVFLWECMGLTPSFVHVLQDHWGQDDISTITNAHPDHEDIQGPAGINVAQTMCEFIPEHAECITAEEQMFPVLKTGAIKKQTKMQQINWLDFGLMTADLFKRFPDEEHPANVALVLQLARTLGIAEDMAIKAMTDNLVPDIGALKVYPVAKVAGRTLEFANGMSANERFSTLSNLKRMQFLDSTLEAKPEEWLVSIINNRADRIARSWIFAKMVAEDLSFDRHVLVGTNLGGLLAYIKKAWRARLDNMAVVKALQQQQDAIPALEKAAKWLRVYYKPELLFARLRFIGSAINFTVDESKPHGEIIEALTEAITNTGTAYAIEAVQLIKDEYQVYQEYEQLKTKLLAGTKISVAKMKVQLSRWFFRKIIVTDSYASGDEIHLNIVKHSLPGLNTRMMGMQNIKGAGFGVVMNWEDWESCYRACDEVLSDDAETRSQGFSYLLGHQQFNALCCDHLFQVLQRIIEQGEIVGKIKERVDYSLKCQFRIGKETSTPRWITSLLKLIENILDPGDSIRRKKKADRIYKDLIKHRISYERAVTELKRLVTRQKGGWLKDKLQKMFVR